MAAFLLHQSGVRGILAGSVGGPGRRPIISKDGLRSF